MSEKEFAPTESRLRQAREKGQIPISQDIVKLVKFAVITETVFFTEDAWRNVLGNNFGRALAYVTSSRESFGTLMPELLLPVVLLILVLSMLAAALGWVTTLAQTQMNIAPMAFDVGWEKLNPAHNLESLFSVQKLLMLLIGPIKVGLVGWVCYAHLKDEIPKVSQVFLVTPSMGWELVMQSLRSLERVSLGCLVVLAVADYSLQRWLTYRSLKMDIEEIKRDYKETEGDPHMKGTRKAMAKNALMEDSPPKSANGANAVIVNPSHIAIALSYDYQPDSLPYIVTKGSDSDAQMIRVSAAELGIPVIRYVGLARQLYAVAKVGDYVATDCLCSVALLYRILKDQPNPKSEVVYEIDEKLANELLNKTIAN